MKHLEFEYRVLVRIEFSRQEIDHLIALSESHYDGVCQAASKGGFLCGMKNVLDIDKTEGGVKHECVAWTFDGYDLQTLCKITEMEGSRVTNGDGVWLLLPLMQLLRKANEESQRLNGDT